jgi:AcrR family transcriptional regulator
MGAARDRWLDEGLRVLAEDGASGVRIDRIAARLGLSKGSFHHHFDGAEGFKKDLLAHYEQLTIQVLEEGIRSAGPDASARAVLGALTSMVRDDGLELYRPELDVAIRAWATSDPDVRAVQGRIDAARVDALESVWRPAAKDAASAHHSALLPYLLAVGASVMVPPVTADELRRLYELLLPLVPDQQQVESDAGAKRPATWKERP